VSRRAIPALVLALAVLPGQALGAVDVLTLWDFGRPEVSEARFREAARNASADDAAILQTQIARTYGLRRRFDEARAVLAPLKPRLAQLNAEAQARYHLEWGRTLASATHRRAELTPETLEAARAAYQEAVGIAVENGLDFLAIDALHMLPFVETDEEAGLKWNQQALAVMSASSQADARRWEGSLRNNIGFSLHALKRYDEALAMFKSNLPVLQRTANPHRIRIGHWMVAWTLRSLGRIDEALAIQLRLEQENRAAGTQDEHVFDELKQLYAAKGDEAKAQHYAALHAAARK
jgi:tetratricopeptide (TPR) repeat protein